MSDNISVPAARVPLVELVNGRYLITKEWMALLLGVFQRVGGFEGFSNQELYGDAAALQSYDELLERIGAAEALTRGQHGEALLDDMMNRLAALEAQNRSQAQTNQALGMMAMDQMTAPAVDLDEVLDKLTVKGDTRLSVEKGITVVGGRSGNGPEKFQVYGGMAVSGSARIAYDVGRVVIGVETDDMYCALQVGGHVRAQTYRINGAQVVGPRISGFPAVTPYAGQTISATYAAAQVQATDNAVKTLSETVKKLVDAHRSHGLIGT